MYDMEEQEPTPPPKPDYLLPLRKSEDPQLLSFYDMPYVEQLKWALRYADRQLQSMKEHHNQWKQQHHIDKIALYKHWEQTEGKKILTLKGVVKQLRQENNELRIEKKKIENELLALQLYVKTINHNQ